MTGIWGTNTEISQLGFKSYLYPCSKPLLVIFKKLYGSSIKFNLFRAATGLYGIFQWGTTLRSCNVNISHFSRWNMISPMYNILIHLKSLSKIKDVFYGIPTENITLIYYHKDILGLS